MSLHSFRYLHKRRILTLIVILTLTSTLFSVTAYSFLGFYNGFTDYVGTGNNVIAIYSQAGSTPFTGIVPLSLESNLTAVKGVITASPETIAPCNVNGQSVFFRGALPQALQQLNTLTILQGQDLNFNDTYSAIVGVNLAQKLNLKTGESILVLGVLSDRYAELNVKGVFQSGTPLDDEAIVPLYVGQWLRGLNYDQVTLIRAKINVTETSANQVYQEIASRTTPQPTTSPSSTTNSQLQQELEALLPLSGTSLNLQSIGVEGSQQFMTSYLNRYGISKDTLIILSVIVLIFSSGTAFIAISLFIRQHATETSALRAIGVTSKKLKSNLFLNMLAWSLIATLAGTLASAAALTVFNRYSYLQVLSHSITFQLDPVVVAADFLLLSLLCTVSVVRTEFKQ